MTTALDFIELSRWAGQRFDLIQANSGNISFKTEDGQMLIKASEASMCEINGTSGFTTVVLAPLRKNLTGLHKKQAGLEKKALEATSESLLTKVKSEAASAQPPLDTFLHAHLDTYGLHTHGIVVHTVGARKNWREIFEQLFPESLCISYTQSDIEMALDLDTQLDSYIKTKGKKPNIIFLQNNGLLVSAQTAQEVKFITEDVTIKLEQFLNITNNTYRLTSVISECLTKVFGSNKVAYLSNDAGLRELIANAKPLFFQPPFCKKTIDYCGKRLLVLNDFDDITTMEQYKTLLNETPRVIICRDLIFFIANSIHNAREIEEALKFHLAVLVVNVTQQVPPQDIHFLSEEHMSHLPAAAEKSPTTTA